MPAKHGCRDARGRTIAGIELEAVSARLIRSVPEFDAPTAIDGKANGQGHAIADGARETVCGNERNKLRRVILRFGNAC